PKLPELASLPASPSRRLGGELTNVSVDPRPRLRAPVVATLRRAAAPLRSTYRFHYHPQCEANAGAQIQAAESPKNLGRSSPRLTPTDQAAPSTSTKALTSGNGSCSCRARASHNRVQRCTRPPAIARETARSHPPRAARKNASTTVVSQPPR